MHISLLPTSKPPVAGPEQALLETGLSWLQAELDLAELPDRKAALRHEIGVLQELAGRDSLAVRELLAAVNALPRFKEPLERLIAVIERRRSFKNLPTLLDHLARTADSPEEEARAHLLHAWYSIAHGRDEARALEAVEGALRAVPNDPGALLSLELLARRKSDGKRLLEALEGQLATTRDPSLSHWLSLELAECCAASGQAERAHALLAAATADPGSIGLRALELRARLGRACGRVEWTLEALTLRAARILVSAPPSSDRNPASARAPARALGALLELAELQSSLGHEEDAVDTLERALEIDPGDPVAAQRLLRQAEKTGRYATVERLVLAELVMLPEGPERAALGVRLAESRLGRNEPLLALEALEVALMADPECWVARAFQLDLLRGTRNPEGHAKALEQLAAQLRDTRAQARLQLLSALEYATRADAPGAARHALAAAERAGVSPSLVARLGRVLAFASDDASWAAAATRRLLETETSSVEQAGLLLESWRTALLSGDDPELKRLEEALGNVPEGRLAARFARAYAPANGGSASDAGTALLALAEQAGDGSARAALEWTVALRWLGAGENARARELLERLQREQPAACVVAGTLTAFLERHAALPAELAGVLASTAASVEDAELAASLCIEAGLRRWQGERSSAAALDFDAAERHVPGAASALSFWARRAREPSLGPSDERGAEAADRLLGALESAIRTNPPNPQKFAELQSALRAVEDADDSPLATAARLQVLLQGRLLGQRSDPALLERLAARHPDASRLVDAWRYLECIAQPEPMPQTLEEVTRKWSQSSESLASALEWLAATQRLGQAARECQARYHLSELLSGSAAELCAASGSLVAQLSGAARAPFLVGNSAPLRLTNLETSPPGSDPRRRARALEGVSPLLGAESEPSLALLRGYNLLAAGDNAAALAAFQRYAEAFPEDPAGFEGQLAAARGGDDPLLLAEATAALGRSSRDPGHAARLFEEAALIFFDQLNDPSAGEAALSRAVELDIRRKSAFDRLFAWVREHGDAARLLELCQRRLAVSVTTDEQRELEWERARASRKLGDTRTALHALERVLGLDPQHGGALTLLGEIYITTQRYAEAADALARLASLPGTPAAERLTSGLYAVDLFENQLDNTPRALEVLLMLHRAGSSTLAVRERLARAAAKSGNWDEAVVVLEQLMFERLTAEERAEAARLALAIHRDRRNDAHSAGHAVEALLALIPHDAEALDLALSGALDPLLTDKLLRASQGALEQRLGRDPFQLDSLKRLARIADRTSDLGVRQVSLGALIALGQGPSSGARAELAALDQRLATTPSVAWTPDLLLELADPDDQGPVAALLELAAPHLVRALGPDARTFQVTRRERIPPSSGLPVRSEVAAWVGALGLGDFELYQSPVSAERIVALATEPLSIILGARVTAPLAPFQRQELVRALFALRRQQGVLTQLDEIDVAALIVALCNLAQQPLSAPNYARQADFERQLNRVLPRKVHKLLPERAQALRSAGVDVGRWVGAALSSLDRAAAIAVGDISLVLADRPPAERAQSTPAPPNDRTRRLASFVLSPGFQWLRQRFGVRLA
jgi:tetratricopeptide (TPR) repeat protein